MVRLFERTLVAEVPCLLGSPRYTRGQDHIGVRLLVANPLGKTEPVHPAAQLNLCKNNVDLLSGFEHGHYIIRCDPLKYLEAAIAQIVCYDHPNKNVGLQDKNRAWSDFVGASIIRGHSRETQIRSTGFRAAARGMRGTALLSP